MFGKHRDPMDHIDALPRSARNDLVAFICASAVGPGKTRVDEADYMTKILTLSRPNAQPHDT